MDITPYLSMMVTKNASDLFIYPETTAGIKVNGHLHALGSKKFSSQEVRETIYGLLTDEQILTFEKKLELNLAIDIDSIGRFRVNVFRQRSKLAMVVRYVKKAIPEIRDLGLPEVLKDLVMERNGLILMVGATGSGKSTTLSSMINFRSKAARGHILTIEDPIEFVYEHNLSMIGQREVGIDTWSYDEALESAMREAPDVILVGEIRTASVMRTTLNMAITGHLCLSTLHAKNAVSGLDRIVNFFPGSERDQLLTDLALNLKAIISQRLVPSVNGKLVPAVEVMLNTAYISELIQKGKFEEIVEAMHNGGTTGMISFDQSLINLYNEGKITAEYAVDYADSKNNVALKIKLSADHDYETNETIANIKLEAKTQEEQSYHLAGKGGRVIDPPKKTN